MSCGCERTGVTTEGAGSSDAPGTGRAMPGGGTKPSCVGGIPRLLITGAKVCRAGAMVGNTAGGASADVNFDRPVKKA